MNSLFSGVSPSHSNMFLPPLACVLAGMAGQGLLMEGWQPAAPSSALGIFKKTIGTKSA